MNATKTVVKDGASINGGGAGRLIGRPAPGRAVAAVLVVGTGITAESAAQRQLSAV